MKTAYFRLNRIVSAAIAVVMAGGLWMGLNAQQAPISRAKVYTNPVIDRNFPDPSVFRDRGYYYAYSTNSRGGNMPCARSKDLVHWTSLPDAMPKLPRWAIAGRTWAPNVRSVIPGKRYAVYFTAHDRATNRQAVGVAFSRSPAGPFTSNAAKPFINQNDRGGSIDPSCFIDKDGRRFLVWKNDGNCCGFDTWLWLQQLSPDGARLVGTRRQLLKQDERWEGSLVEAPTLWMHRGEYYLFYSANGYGSCRYAIGYALAPSIFGPYRKPSETSWVASTAGVCGPGGEDIIDTSDGNSWMVYHSWEKGRAYRAMDLDQIRWVGDHPILDGPSRVPEVAPPTLP